MGDYGATCDECGKVMIMGGEWVHCRANSIDLCRSCLKLKESGNLDQDSEKQYDWVDVKDPSDLSNASAYKINFASNKNCSKFVEANLKIVSGTSEPFSDGMMKMAAAH